MYPLEVPDRIGGPLPAHETRRRLRDRSRTPPVYNWPTMLARKDKMVGSLVGGIGQLFKSHGVDHYQGFGKITGKTK